MRIIDMSKREKALTGLALALLLALAGYHLFFRPLQLELEGLKMGLAEKEAGLEEGQALLGELEELEKGYREIESSYLDVLNLLPDSKAVSTLLIQLEEALGERQLHFSLFQPMEVERVEEGPAVYPFTLELAGSYGELVGFLEELEEFPRFVHLAAMTLTGGRGEGQLEARLHLEVFYLPGEDGEQEAALQDQEIILP